MMEMVHSGLVPSCDSDKEGTRVGFTEDVVNCPECLDAWAAQGMPKFIVRSGETGEQFRERVKR